MPAFFVTASAFENQLQYLQRNAHVFPLREAVARLQDGSLPPRAVSLTFDDGYANNLHIALPLLHKYRTPASVFLCSGHIESGDIFHFHKVRLIRLRARLSDVKFGNDGRLDFRSKPMATVSQEIDRLYKDMHIELTKDQHHTLRPLTVEEIKATAPEVVEFGAHTHTHCILANESPQRREQEIRTSIAKVSEWTGKPARTFSYPNGESGDFGELDKEVLRSEGVVAAVTGIGGSNKTGADRLELMRYPIGLFHDDAGFSVEVSGFRSALLGGKRSVGL
jgi:peptidoglycan/xylan/chitin deacetylase (PgdA/CDA1 family)